MFISIFPNTSIGNRLRGYFLGIFVRQCGRNLKIAKNVRIYSPEKLSLGDNVYIGYCAYLGNGEIEIGDETVIGPFACITPSNHTYMNGSFRFGGSKYSKITIGKGCWLAAHVTITAGVNLAEVVLVAAGAVVTRNVPKYFVVGGVPAKIIKAIDE